jgi:dTDP-glucose 4,6-dehydratase
MFATLLVTGGAGFIGSNFIRYMLEKYPELTIINLDALTYAGDLANLGEWRDDPRHEFVHGDILDETLVDSLMARAEAVVHFAAESHVDRSIASASVFVKTNVQGTQMLLDAARRHGVARFIQISTDEVYGTLGPEGYFSETTPLAPNSPYSASKAGADMLARAYYETYGVPVLITRCSNNYGPNQHAEKLIPTLMTRARRDEPLPIYGDGQNVRDWLHVADHCRGIEMVLESGRVGEVYNIGGHNEWRNLDIAKLILQKLGKPESLITLVEDRLGHDRRYAIDALKIREELGWEPQVAFVDGLDALLSRPK